MNQSVVIDRSSSNELREPVERTIFEPIQEVRFAVVLFGGVSLAVYINGVVQELLRLVRASAPGDKEEDGQRYALLDEGTARPLRHSEKIYRELATWLPYGQAGGRKIRTRFVIDVISGTSAGGINGVFLAKALTHNLDIQSLAELWEKEADLAKLLNDEKAAKEIGLETREPASLLSGRRMTYKLLEAFRSLERLPGETELALVEELKLQTTATDLNGRPVLLKVGDSKVFERRHRHIFEFEFAAATSTSVEKKDHFSEEYDPFLAFAARATSAFPVAFEPATLREVEEIVAYPRFAKYKKFIESAKWQELYEDYRKAFKSCEMNGDTAFRDVPFGDGGVLDNKPFSRIFEAIAERSGGIPVDRKLIYVEPSPEHPEDEGWQPASPGALENLWLSLVKLPGAESIREDLDRLEEYQNLVRRAEIARLGQRDDIAKSEDKDPEHFRIEYEKWKKADLRTMIDRFGIVYGPYHRLKVAKLMDEMAALLTTCWGWEKGSEIQTALHEVVKAWRSRNYQIYREGDDDTALLKLEVHRSRVDIEIDAPDPGTKKTENQLVGELDLWWGLRRLRHVREQLGEIVTDARTLRDRFIHLFPEVEAPPQRYTDDQMALARSTATEISLALGSMQGEILEELARTEQQRLEVLDKDELPSLERALLQILHADGTPRPKAERQRMAENLLDDRALGEALERGIAAIVARLEELSSRIQKLPKNLLRSAREPIRIEAEIWDYPAELIEKLAAFHYRYFEQYDVAVYPLLYGTGSENASRIDVVRISPEDASRLIDQRDKNTKKLAGDTLGHFGGFLDAEGRRSDRIWGRLDAAERILECLVTDPVRRRSWREQLQEEILSEEMGADAEAAIGDVLKKYGPAKQRHQPEAENEEKDQAAVDYFKEHDPLALWVHELPERDRFALINRMQALITPRSLVQAFVDRTKGRELDETRLVLGHMPRAINIVEKMLGQIPAAGRSSRLIGYLRRVLQMLFWLASGITTFISDEKSTRKYFRGATAAAFLLAVLNTILYSIKPALAVWVLLDFGIPLLLYWHLRRDKPNVKAFGCLLLGLLAALILGLAGLGLVTAIQDLPRWLPNLL